MTMVALGHAVNVLGEATVPRVFSGYKMAAATVQDGCHCLTRWLPVPYKMAATTIVFQAG